MKRNCNFLINPAYVVGMVLLWAGVFALNILEVHSALTHFLCGAGCGLTFIGLVYGSSKARPIFDRFHAFKLRLLGREEDTPC